MAYQYTDVAIIGGGMIGGALALGLAKQGLMVTVVDQKELPLFNPTHYPDIRISAISAASIKLLRNLDVLEAILAMRAHPYYRLETWEWENARVTFDAKELKLPLLGYIIENNVLKSALWQALKMQSEVKLYSTTTLKSLYKDNNQQFIILDNGEKLAAKLVVGADGANSHVRKITGISMHACQYQQSCMLIIVSCKNEPGNSIWQHFTPRGPHAFLPLFGHWALLVWYDTPEYICRLQTMPMSQLQDEINNQFSIRLGEITPISSRVFPLVRRHAMQYVRNGLVLIGDAAHTIHPLAGQGLNLGYRDVDALLTILSDARNSNERWTSKEVLKRYQKRRMIDNSIMQFWMDLFHFSFSNNIFPIRLFCNIGMMVVERAGFIKRRILKYILNL